MNESPRLTAATPVVPDPMNGSHMVFTPSGNWSIAHDITPRGFCVGCSRTSEPLRIMPFQSHSMRRTAFGMFVHASSQSAKSLVPFFLSQTNQHDDGGRL